MTGLTEWLLEQIAEEEGIARQALEDPDSAVWWHDLATDAEVHVGRWNPIRVLDECTAKRRVIAEHTDSDCPEDSPCPVCLDEVENDEGNSIVHMKPQPCLTLRALALPYATGPGYREEWKP